MKLSVNPPKGMYDFDPKEFAVRKYIFDTWRNVCLSYGYEEYLTPVLENADIYRAKSGEDVGGKELMFFKDKAGRELALRPEMTPSVTRLVSKEYSKLPKPIRYFSIANFFRNEKPQRGRNREFWQLNYDIFGSSSLNAEIEVIQIALDIILKFNPPKGSFKIYINNRKLIDDVLNFADIKNKTEVVRLLDKYNKLKEDKFVDTLKDTGLSNSQIDVLLKYISSKDEKALATNLPVLKSTDGFLEILKILKYFKDINKLEFVEFNPSIIRGFDYYDGTVFEVFDLYKDNTRSMFGGGRYNGLSGLFLTNTFEAVGAAPGDETLRLFLESWGLLSAIQGLKIEKYYVPVLSSELFVDANKIAAKLRKEGKFITLGLEPTSLSKALNIANKQNYQYLVIFGSDEKQGGYYTLKSMVSGEQERITLN